MKTIKQKKFKFQDVTWTIKWVDQIDSENESLIYGRTQFDTLEILISTKLNGNDIPLIVQERTLYHELIHMILDENQFNSESRCESLVEAIAKGIYELKHKTNLL